MEPIKTELEYKFEVDGYMSHRDYERDISVLVGQTITSAREEGAEIIFETEEGYVYKMHHEQDCCENVYVESITGDLEDLVGQEILLAEERGCDETPVDPSDADEYGSFTWTFYCIRCVKCSVDIRWYGSSNGYYSESVSFYRIK